MTASTPRVSVIIPCFNLGAYLPEAVDSVLAQTYQDFEILIVDDGSTDPETVALLETFQRPKTTVFRTPNQGLAKARNYLIELARGIYLCALDADDKLHPEYLQRTTELLDSEPSLTFVSTHLRMFGVQEGTWPDTDSCDLAALLADDTVITPALVRRMAVLAVGAYDERMPAQGDEDWELWITLVEAGYRGRIIPEVLFFYRRRHGSMVEHCTAGDTHLALVRYIVSKHEASYRQHLLSVLREKERRVGDLRRTNVSLEREINTELRPALLRKRAELETLRQRLTRERSEEKRLRDRATAVTLRDDNQVLREQLQLLHTEYQRSQDEVRALRDSASWKLTQPLRRAYDLLRRNRT